jgi:hypothetical protein
VTDRQNDRPDQQRAETANERITRTAAQIVDRTPKGAYGRESRMHLGFVERTDKCNLFLRDVLFEASDGLAPDRIDGRRPLTSREVYAGRLAPTCRPVSDPMPGDVFSSAPRGRSGHLGIVEEVYGPSVRGYGPLVDITSARGPGLDSNDLSAVRLNGEWRDWRSFSREVRFFRCDRLTRAVRRHK